MHVVVTAFTIIGTKEHPTSPGGNHVLALINTNENYDGLKEATEIYLMKSSTQRMSRLSLI